MDNYHLKHWLNFYEGDEIIEEGLVDQQSFYGDFNQELNWFIDRYRNNWDIIVAIHANKIDTYKIIKKNYKPQFETLPLPSQLMIPSKALSEITGSNLITFRDAVEKVRKYIEIIGHTETEKLNNDFKLKAIFQDTPVSQFNLNILAKHLAS